MENLNDMESSNNRNNMETLESLLKSYLQSNEKRLDRIEAKIDTMADTIVAIARAEEKLINLEEARDRTSTRISSVEKNVYTLDRKVSEYIGSKTFSDKFFWLAVTASGTLMSAYLINNYIT